MQNKKINELIFNAKYQTYKKEDFNKMCERVAFDQEQLMSMILHQFMPAGRQLTARGYEEFKTLFNCYVLSYSNIDNRGKDSRVAISDFESKSDVVSSRGGGIGANFSVLRPSETRITANGKHVTSDMFSSGTLSFIDRFAYSQSIITQGGSRRGAIMGVLGIWHPEIIKFINSKQDLTKMNNMNISVLINDKFIKAVIKDKNWKLEFPNIEKVGSEIYDKEWDGNIYTWKDKKLPTKTYQTINARELWNMIIDCAWQTGEPGILFYDNINNVSNFKESTLITATNPCVVGDTLVMTNIGWIRIKNLQKYKDRYDFLTIVTQDKSGVLLNSMLTWVDITERNAQIYKTSLSNGNYCLTNSKHKFYKRDFSEVKVSDLKSDTEILSNSGNCLDIVGVEKLNYKENVYDLTAVPNYNFFSELNKEEWICVEKIILNNNIEYYIYDVVQTNNGSKFAIDLVEGDSIK
jgi:ribonucleotide reductase alpha subunit